MCIGKHMIKSWSATQQTIAMSSGEAELYAMVKGAARTKGLVSMIQEYGLNLVDACAQTLLQQSALFIVRALERQDASRFSTFGCSPRSQTAA